MARLENQIEDCHFQSLNLPNYEISVPYMAALVDGEGSIHIIKPVIGTHTLKIKITMTNELVIREVQKKFGGRVHGPYRHSGHIHHLPTWEWNVISRSAYELLIELYPYMIVKREQAHIAIDFYHGSFMCRGYRNQYNPLTQEELHDRDVWYYALKYVNKFGGLADGEINSQPEEEDTFEPVWPTG